MEQDTQIDIKEIIQQLRSRHSKALVGSTLSCIGLTITLTAYFHAKDSAPEWAFNFFGLSIPLAILVVTETLNLWKQSSLLDSAMRIASESED